MAGFAINVFSGCSLYKPEKIEDVTTDPVNDSPIAILPVADAGIFAQWKEDSITYTPSVPKYDMKADLSNVYVADSFYLSDDHKNYLGNNYFVVVNSWGNNREYFELYEANRYSMVPNFITTDSILHTYHLYFDYLLRSLEEHELYDTALNLSEGMMNAAQKQYQALKGTDFEDAAKRNVAYFAIGLNLLDSTKEIPSEVKEIVGAELKLISAHEGITPSNLFGTKDDPYLEDYSQYIARGHYTKTEKLKKYFQALMWYGRMTFRMKSSDETASALLIVSALKNDSSLLNKWDTLFEPINFFVGEPDDLVYYDYKPLFEQVFGTFDLKSFSADKLNEFVKLAKGLRNPSINSMVIFDPELIKNDRDEETKGFRFLGQRSTIDASIFQQLVYRSVDKNAEGEKRMLPRGLDIAATMGSKEAYEILDKMKETEYEKYIENMNKMKDVLAKLTSEDWTKNLYFGWISTIKTLLKEYTEGYPQFMLSKEWKLKELMTFLGSWNELKHDTILYAKQVYAELGGGPGYEETPDDRGYVEPNPELYNKLASLVQFTIDGLDSRKILNSVKKEELNKLKELVLKLRDISIKELENKTLTDEEYEFIRAYGGSLEHFWNNTLSAEEKEMDIGTLLNGSPAAIVADVATDPNGFVLEEGTGRIFPIYVAVLVDGKLKVAKGGMFSQYEFTWPLNDRLTDEKWREILDENKQPNLPEWAKFIIAE